ncbi:PREDICTED: DNA-directed RNA polymerase III subunit rpc31 [Camelina sativa]|uniref:DNA-directed RNA polymerase III subunit rpc31 n=1 Tax=Camelina sativa TaxID=90675 RepID=A0ABM0TMH3_CAMSA|nr:PREDICTED: DNA-directed RNA polymerase III subunit rpc31 [Camelina sativa]
MSWRGRGRGRGRGGGAADYGKPEPFEIFPDITLPDRKLISIDSQLVQSYNSFNRFWRNSPYHLGDGVLIRENESLDIERFSDSLKPKSKSNNKGSFYDFLVLRPDNFPKELLGDTRRERPVKRAKWSQEADLLKLDVFEKLEAKHKAEGTEEKEEGEDDEEVEESDGEESDNGDYDQNQDFDDDDDDYNQADDDFEAVY